MVLVQPLPKELLITFRTWRRTSLIRILVLVVQYYYFSFYFQLLMFLTLDVTGGAYFNTVYPGGVQLIYLNMRWGIRGCGKSHCLSYSCDDGCLQTDDTDFPEQWLQIFINWKTLRIFGNDTTPFYHIIINGKYNVFVWTV